VCECTKPSWWKAWVKTRWHWMTYPLFTNLVSDATVQRVKDSVSDSVTVQRLKGSVSDIATVPHLVICHCKCHVNLALTVEVSTPPTTTEQKTTIGN
jgi:hypothetical protein